MNKPIPPYKAKFSINHEQLYLTSDIAYHAGALGERDYIPEPKDRYQGVLPLLYLSGIKLTPSQTRGLFAGEEIPSIPLADSLARLYKRINKLNPYDYSIVSAFEEAYFIDGVPNRLGRKAEDCPYVLVTTNKIEPMMKALFNFLASSNRKTHPILLSGMAYVEIMAIAPYSDKNLALALFVAKAILATYQKQFAYLPFEAHFLRKKEELDKIFEACAEKADMDDFLNAYLKVVRGSLDAIIRKKTNQSKGDTAQVRKLLAVMEEGRSYSAKELCDALKLKSRLGLMRNYISPALEAKLIRRSEPNSPTSRTQRYSLLLQKKEGSFGEEGK